MLLLLYLVEVTGLEPAASCSQSKRATNCATPRYLVLVGALNELSRDAFSIANF